MNETVLEMHYHRPLFDLLRNTIGLGQGRLQFFKYSPQREVFIGFDQAFVTSELSEESFFQELRDAAMNNDYQLPATYFGLFLQFKVVSEMKVRSKYTPPSIQTRPYYRASLDTQKNQNTGFSQHELLYSLKNNSNALVYYACPMIFDRSCLYDINVDLSNLRLVDVGSAPSSYDDNDHHFLFFSSQNSTPIWKSEPANGKAISTRLLGKRVSKLIKQQKPDKSAHDLLTCLTKEPSSSKEGESSKFDEIRAGGILSEVAHSLTIIKLTQPE